MCTEMHFDVPNVRKIWLRGLFQVQFLFCINLAFISLNHLALWASLERGNLYGSRTARLRYLVCAIWFFL